MFSLLFKPYPYQPFSAKDLRVYFFIGFFTFLFLILFQPFGISEWRTDHKNFKLFCFGCISFIVPALVKWSFSKVPGTGKWQDNWKVWKEIMIVLLTLLMIALGNLACAWSIGLAQFGLEGFLSAVIVTCLIGVFPITFSVLAKHNRFLALNVKDAEEMESAINRQESSQREKYRSNAQLILTADNEKDKLGLFADQLLYIESADNYCTVVFLQGELKSRELIRSSLRRIESQIGPGHIVRCHRTYIANLANVSHVEGNAQGYKISFKGCSDTVPVSRSYGKSILDQLRRLNKA